MVSRLMLIGAIGAVSLVVIVGGAIGAALVFQEPTIDGVEVGWGEVTDDTSEILVTVVVDNPNPVGVPGIVGIGYTASLNDVAIAEGEERGIGLSTGRNEITLSIPIENDKLAAWWVTHIDRGEQSTMAIEASIEGPLGLSMALPTQEQPFETDILGSFGGGGETAIDLFGEPFLVVGEQTASWGEATDDATPMTFAAEVTNHHDRPVSFDGVGYVVEMNGITMGAGEDRTGFTVAPGETATLEIQAAIETEAIDDWWVSHLQGGEETTLTVRTYAIVDGGAAEPVELDLIELGMDLQTDLLGGGGATSSDVSTEVGGDLAFEEPSVTLGALAWGEVTDATTEIEATLDIDNPNAGSALNDLVTIAIQQRTTINDVEVADDTATIEGLPTGSASEALTVTLDNSKVPEWWARHVNQGETSTISIASTATIDVGVTAFNLELDPEDREFATDILADMNSDRDQTITVRGREAATLLSTSAEWGTATAEETPIDAAATIRNERQFATMTISGIGYIVTMNDVTVADGTDPASLTLGPGETGTLDFTMVLDSTAMDEWWVSHLRNGEETALTVEVTATVEVEGETEQVTFDFGGDQPFVTDILGGA